MYIELLKLLDGGKNLKKLDPIKDIKIEFDQDADKMDINELV